MIQIRSMCISAHLDSFCRKLNELEGLEFMYLSGDPGKMRRQIGWDSDTKYKNEPIDAKNTERAYKCDLLIEMLREFSIMEARVATGKKTIYMSERWFKPIPITSFNIFGRIFLVRLPGVVRMLVPSYFRMVKRFVSLMDDSNFYVLPCGVHAANDFARMHDIVHGKFWRFFVSKKLEIIRELGGNIKGFPRMKLWGYFVEPSKEGRIVLRKNDGVLRILWVGRMLDWKRVDVLIRVFKKLKKRRNVALQICGEGSQLEYLRLLAGTDAEDGLEWHIGKITFNGYVKNEVVRELMRQASVYVMPSNAEEGWGAAVSDAMSEGCQVISTFEAGSSATLLPIRNLYHCNSESELLDKLETVDEEMVEYRGDWSGDSAAKVLLEIVK